MGRRIIENRRVNDTNIQKNGPRKAPQQEFVWPSSVVRTFQEREAVIAALQVFLQIQRTNLKLQGRDHEDDQALVGAAMLVLGRIG